MSDAPGQTLGRGSRGHRHLAFREDSPAFRRDLELCEENARNVRTHVKNVRKTVHSVYQTGARSGEATKAWANELLAFGGPNQAVMSAGVGPALWTISACFKEVADLSYASLLNVEKEFANRIDIKVEEDAKVLKELKTRFTRADEKYRAAIDRARSLKKDAKDAKVIGADRELIAAKLALENARFDLVAKLNELESGRQVDLLECMCECVRVQLGFFASAQEHLARLAANVPTWQQFLAQKRTELAKLAESNLATQQHLRRLSQVHSDGALFAPHAAHAHAPTTSKEGYLFKRSTHGTGWKRVWVELRDAHLLWSSQRLDRRASGADEARQHGVSLLLCTVQLKDTSDSARRFCFEVVTPDRTISLQAESDVDRERWVDSLRTAIEQAFHALDTERGMPSNSTKLDASGQGEPAHVAVAPLLELRKLEDNKLCADCGDSAPDWAVVNHGVVVCIECSGLHRSLGVHVSKVRSLTLDTWDVSLVDMMGALGNRRANRLLEYAPIGNKPVASSPRCVATPRDAASAAPAAGVRARRRGRQRPRRLRGSHSARARARARACREEKKAWIEAKYRLRMFVRPCWVYGALAHVLCAAVRRDDAPMAEALIAQGAPLEDAVSEAELPGDDGALSALGWVAGGPYPPLTPVQHAAHACALRCVELLCHWGVALGPSGAARLSPLHTAAAAGHADAVGVLLRRGAPCEARDATGRTPADVAALHEHAAVGNLLDAAARPRQESLPGATSSVRTSRLSDNTDAGASTADAQAASDGASRGIRRSLSASRGPRSMGTRVMSGLLWRSANSRDDSDLPRSGGSTDVSPAVSRPVRTSGGGGMTSQSFHR